MPRHNNLLGAGGGGLSIRLVLRPVLYMLGFVIGVAALWMLTSLLSPGSASAAPGGRPGAVAVMSAKPADTGKATKDKKVNKKKEAKKPPAATKKAKADGKKATKAKKKKSVSPTAVVSMASKIRAMNRQDNAQAKAEKPSKAKPKKEEKPKKKKKKGGGMFGWVTDNPVTKSVTKTVKSTGSAVKKGAGWAKKNSRTIGHTALDGAGMVPVVGEVADGANAIWYAAEGDKKNAAISAAAMVPGAGWAATGGKYAVKGAKAVAKGGGKSAAKGGGKSVKKTPAAKGTPKPKKSGAGSGGGGGKKPPVAKGKPDDDGGKRNSVTVAGGKYKAGTGGKFKPANRAAVNKGPKNTGPPKGPKGSSHKKTREELEHERFTATGTKPKKEAVVGRITDQFQMKPSVSNPMLPPVQGVHIGQHSYPTPELVIPATLAAGKTALNWWAAKGKAKVKDKLKKGKDWFKKKRD